MRTDWDGVDEMTGMPMPHYMINGRGDNCTNYQCPVHGRQFRVPCEDVHDEYAEGWTTAAA